MEFVMKRTNVLIDANELLNKIKNENIRIYDTTILFFPSQSDLTAHEQYLQGHIPGAAFLDQNKLSDPTSDYMFMVLPEKELENQIGNMGITKDMEIVLYAPEILPAATRAWWVLRYAGHDHVRILNGGLSAWKEAGGEIEQGERQYDPTIFKAHYRPSMFANKEEVLRVIENDDVNIVNALPQASYQAAHIAGSTCFSCMDLMDGMNAFIPVDQLISKLTEESRYKRIITYCGGGIAATVNAVAHFIAGHENVAVYDGSMYEWMSEDLPMVMTGDGNWAIWE